MSSGSFTTVVPHFCGLLINVHIRWWYSHGSYENPLDSDMEITYGHEHYDEPIERCPKCGVLLDRDDLFQHSIELADANAQDRGEYVPGDEDDYEPEPEWDEVWDKIDPRYN